MVQEFTDRISGAKDRRPGLDSLLLAARRREFDVLIVWKLDRLARSLRQLVNLLAEFEALGISFVSLRDGFDLSTPAGRLQAQIIGAMAEFERSLIVERVKAGIASAKRNGKHCGRPRRVWSPRTVARVKQLRAEGKSWQAISEQTHVAVGTLFSKFGKTLSHN